MNYFVGNVGIGTTSPSTTLEVAGTVKGTRVETLQVDLKGTSSDFWSLQSAAFYPDTFGIVRYDPSANASKSFIITPAGNVGIGTTTPSVKLEVAGSLKVTGIGNSITTPVLSITGGSDVAEPFAMSGGDIPKGAVVVIDDAHPGQLKLSQRAYDKRVAGIVSGAGGVNPGLTLSQQSLVEGGQNVALTGRVYALADAANAPIEPGDLLTTSAIPGHAMKATDPAKSQGAIIGKAMSHLKTGRGLVLVLVTLQ